MITEKILFVGLVYLLIIVFIVQLSLRGNFQRLFKKLSTMLAEGTTNIWSATRFIMIEAWLLILGVWAFISLWKMALQDIPQSVVYVLLISAGLKYFQKKAENNLPPPNPISAIKQLLGNAGQEQK
jgi:hypothetical protein